MYFEQLRWANDTLYKPFGAVEAQLIYCWGTAGFGMTDNTDSSMDVSQERAFHDTLEAWAQTQPDYLGYVDESNGLSPPPPLRGRRGKKCATVCAFPLPQAKRSGGLGLGAKR
jgi:hypothetical protein